MLPKLLLIIVVAGAAAAALLVNRQHRIDTAHEISTIHQRMLSQEQTLWRMRAEIARQVRPEQVRQQMKRVGGQWVAIPEKPHRRAIDVMHIAAADPESSSDEGDSAEQHDPSEEYIGG